MKGMIDLQVSKDTDKEVCVSVCVCVCACVRACVCACEKGGCWVTELLRKQNFSIHHIALLLHNDLAQYSYLMV
jgi:hypothetical protein